MLKAPARMKPSSDPDDYSLEPIIADDCDVSVDDTGGGGGGAMAHPKWRQEYTRLPKEIRNLVAGGLAGMAAKTVVAPLDRIKILYQISSAEFHFRGLPRVAANIIRDEGISALWKGNVATMIRVFPYAGIQFMVFDRCKVAWLHEHQRQRSEHSTSTSSQNQQPAKKWGLSPVESLVSGMCAGAVSAVSTYPLDLTRAQLAVLRKKKGANNLGFFNILTKNYTQRGVTGLFRGVTPTLMGILPYSGIAFTLNEQGKRKIQLMTGRDLKTIERIQCGAISGLFAQTITYPLEVTRRRMQTLEIVSTSGKDGALHALIKEKAVAPVTHSETLVPDHPRSMVSIMKDLYHEQGIRGFFKGVSMNWMKGPVSFSISFTAFDIIQSFTETEEERRTRMPHSV